ncbi:MAG: restriction endonuclease [Burkholderiales bacterium]|nr:restriction endonuclease [Burkholderiales bacterium]
MPPTRTYEPAFDAFGDFKDLLIACYPISRPAPPHIEPPPSWTPWHPELPDATFSPPLWQGWPSFLNVFVHAVHREEMEKVARATARKTALLEECQRRNDALAALSKEAENSYDRASAQQQMEFSRVLGAWKASSEAWADSVEEERLKVEALREQVRLVGGAGLLKRIELTMASIQWPAFVSAEGESKFDAETGIVIHEHRFPDTSELEWLKVVALKSGRSMKAANQKEGREAAANLYPALCLRLAAEIARLDDDDIVKGIAINGWADYVEKATGRTKRAYCASLFANKGQILALKLSALHPIEAFSALKGISARSLELTPIAPILRLDTSDPRFIDPKEVLAKMAEGENLAAMDWGEFEHLCRELFERAFASTGAVVKVTQASRDLGVDAVVFDPDPLRGGKIVIQAKRYTNTVDVSAVRDLYGAVINEGAIKGILVTTSHFGPESYSFAKDKPITLLNGNEMLGLLSAHGYRFRIDLADAKAKLQTGGGDSLGRARNGNH